MLGCGSMRIVVGWFRGNYDAYFEVYEVYDEELDDENLITYYANV
jgi:hypothetical protein